MRTDLPVCTRCCFCVPLRYGLLTWAYIKLVCVTILSLSLVVSLVHVLEMYISYHFSSKLYDIILISVVLIVFLIEIGLTITFIVGGHMKNVRLMRVFYVYNIVLLVISSILMVVAIVMMIISIDLILYRTWGFISMCANFFFSIMVQLYYILLMRSEILKLEAKYGFSFVNNAAEGECTMSGDTQNEADWKAIEAEPKNMKSGGLQ